jgi:hypothetical protein
MNMAMALRNREQRLEARRQAAWKASADANSKFDAAARAHVEALGGFDVGDQVDSGFALQRASKELEAADRAFQRAADRWRKADEEAEEGERNG